MRARLGLAPPPTEKGTKSMDGVILTCSTSPVMLPSFTRRAPGKDAPPPGEGDVSAEETRGMLQADVILLGLLPRDEGRLGMRRSTLRLLPSV